MMMRSALLVVFALCAGALLVAGTDRVSPERAPRPEDRRDLPERAARPGSRPVMPRAAADRPIAGEAHVFRRVADSITLAVHARRRAGAHPRTLAGFRALRAYPGAPPRVPHGLTAEELRGAHCNTCHLRGGYSPRFGAYVPLTPHPELQSCLQCHATNADLVELPRVADRPDARCRQCHRPGAVPALDALLDWRPADWPQLAAPDRMGAPPGIPHDLALRGDCAACHAGAGAVAEIRTSHADRTNCRQCHVEEWPGPDAPPEGAGGSP